MMVVRMMLMTGTRIIPMLIFRFFHDVDHDSFPLNCGIPHQLLIRQYRVATVLHLFGNGYSSPIVGFILP
jgi:hypothetical protein